MATATHSDAPLSAEEFVRRARSESAEELVKGRVVPIAPPGIRHGWITVEFAFLLRTFLRQHDLGRVVAEAGVVTQRGPDTVRGPDLSFFSYERLPRADGLPKAYNDLPPDLVVEVLSPDERWPRVLAKVVEYLDAGVTVVLLIDPDRRNVQVYGPDQPVMVLGEADDLTFPEVLGDFRVRVGDFLG